MVRNVHCVYPNILTLELEQAGKSLTFFSPDMYKIAFSTYGYLNKDPIDPCNALAGSKAKVDYAEVQGSPMAGQMLAIELSK